MLLQMINQMIASSLTETYYIIKIDFGFGHFDPINQMKTLSGINIQGF